MRIVLADRQGLFLDALRAVLADVGHQVLAATMTRDGLVDVVRGCRPDVCLLDSTFPDGDAISDIADLVRAVPGLKVVVLSANGGPEFVRQAFDAGAYGFVHKSRGLAAVLEALARVAAGARVTADSVAPRNGGSGSSARRQVSRLAAYLTPRELECLRLLAGGVDTPEMARRLGVSVATVRSHVQSILTKLGAHSRLEVASLAIRYGLVPEGGTERSA